ncbi:UNVERIFIED_CONTAM: putative cytochrome c biosynthesis ccmC-like mitochondrial protein [Sesamum calycinum]|uniref:Cytochrome c biosynthesis ccmC-like mitochondrial protein n=4 Tax=Sesamum TaxID=4181 RepID=A0AAW2J4F4_9LAMI
MGGLTGYLFPQPIRDSVFSTERGLEYLSKGHNSTRDKKRRSMVIKIWNRNSCGSMWVHNKSRSKGHLAFYFYLLEISIHSPGSAFAPDVLRERELASRLNLSFIAMAIHLSLRVAPLDLQQGGNSRIPYVHVPAARMSILVYIATAINTFLFLLTKHPLFLRSSGTGTEMGAFSTLFTLVTGGFRGRPMWGTFWVWDARLTSVFISFLIYLGALCFQKLPVEPAPISIRAGPIDIPIIKSSVNWWNTSHQPGSISRSGTSIHVPMPIPILSNFANSPLSTPILFVLETRLPIPSFLESPLKEEIEAREGIPKPSSLAESLCIHG